MQTPNELDLAQLKHEMRQLYKDQGYVGALQIVYELLLSANLMMDVVNEERNNEKKV